MTSAEMRAARAQGQSASDFARVQREAAAGTEPSYDADSPDASALIRAAIGKRAVGRPVGSGKEQVAIRLDHDVLAAFRAEGRGWQTRVNAALREWLAQHPHRRSKA